jgi:hypothetical protein
MWDIWSQMLPTTAAGWICSTLAITFTMACLVVALLDEGSTSTPINKRKRQQQQMGSNQTTQRTFKGNSIAFSHHFLLLA